MITVGRHGPGARDRRDPAYPARYCYDSVPGPRPPRAMQSECLAQVGVIGEQCVVLHIEQALASGAANTALEDGPQGQVVTLA